MMRIAVAVVGVVAVGCGNSKCDPGLTCGGGDDGADAAVTADFVDLVGRDWLVPPGSADTYKCRRVMVPEDMWIGGFRAIAPVGTHHTVVTFSNQRPILLWRNCGGDHALKGLVCKLGARNPTQR